MIPQARQAVLIVHGIGQQRPMTTLSSFVEGLRQDNDLVFASPDIVAEYRDMRRVKVTWLPKIVDATRDHSSPADDAGSRPPSTTDFYELYWANLVIGSELRHVTSWLAGLLRHPLRIAPRLRRFLLYNVGWAVIAALIAALLLMIAWLFPESLGKAGAVMKIVGGLIAPLAVGWLVWHLGDVARYLNSTADNVNIQRAVRREGVDRLRKLHEKTFPGSSRPMYERIVVVGHSLGSVVAFDVVRDYWTEASNHYGTTPDNSPAAKNSAGEVEKHGEALWAQDPTPVAHNSDPGFSEFQRDQRRLFGHLRHLTSTPPKGKDGEQVPTVRWAVSDLITLACPLTHADLLLVPGSPSLSQAQWERALPTCPPRRQTNRPSYRHRYVRGPRKGTESWHQSALYAFTRWTNVYFDADVVGGPLQRLFGPGILDVSLKRPKGLRGWFPLVHSMYNRDERALSLMRRIIWDGGTRDDPASIRALQRASLQHAVQELKLVDVDQRRGAVHAAPLLRKYGHVEREKILALLAASTDATSDRFEDVVSLAVRNCPTLLTEVIVNTDDLNPSAMPDVDQEEEPEEQTFSATTIDWEQADEPEEPELDDEEDADEDEEE